MLRSCCFFLTLPFRELPVHPWQCAAANRNYSPLLNSDRPPYRFHGRLLGPHPFIALGSSAVAGEEVFSPFLSALNYSHGALSLSILSSRYCDATEDFLSCQCHEVARMMDTFNCGWGHFIGYSVGALVAAKMAWLYPEKIGTMIIVDTPLFNSEWGVNSATRKILQKAVVDSNVSHHSSSQLAFMLSELRSSIEPPPPCPCEADAEIYSSQIFPSQVNVLQRDDSRYLSFDHIAAIRHPAMLLSPSSGSLADGPLHAEHLNMRRATIVKCAASHRDLVVPSEDVATEVAKHLGSWINNYDIDVMMQRKYEQAAKEMQSLLSGASAGPNNSETKKEKKKKKKRK